MARRIAAIGGMLLLLACSCERRTEQRPVADHPEIEPNDAKKEAMLLEEGVVLEGTVDPCQAAKGDTDMFFLLGHAGFLYRIEFESRDAAFAPVVAVADAYLPIRTIYPASAGRVTVEVYAPFESPIYLTVTDEASREECLSAWEDGRYWLRVTKRWACGLPAAADLLAEETPVMFDLSDKPYGARLVPVSAGQGMYAVALDSERRTSDKKMILVDCLTGELLAGSDDRDHDAGDSDPYLYEQLGGARDLRLVVERHEEDLRKEPSPEDIVHLSLALHDPRQELEPNDRFLYADRFDPDGTEGVLGDERNIEGVWQADRDIFRMEATRGAEVSFPIVFGESGPVRAELWASSTDAGGYTMFPIRQVKFDAVANANYRIEGYLPYTGTLYLLLQGTGIPYTFLYDEGASFEALNSSAHITFDRCASTYLIWSFPPFVNAVRFALSSPAPAPMLQIFDENRRPMLFLDPLENGGIQSVYLTRLSGQSRLLFGVLPVDCAAPEGGEATLHVAEAPFHVEDPGVTAPGAVVDVTPDATYIGWIDTDVPLIENRWRFTPDRDGALILLTTPVWELDTAMLDTVLRVYEEGSTMPIAESDDLIEWLSFHNESFLQVPVTEGKVYEISVKPFMDASSNIEAMNIHLHYGLDVRFEP